MKRLNLLLLLPLSLLCTVMMAQEITVDAAKGHAVDFLSRQSVGPNYAKGTRSSFDLSLAYTSKSEGKTCFYVFNIGDDNGFVIAGGDEAAQQILGYSDHGSFHYETAPENFKWWLSQYTEQIAHAQAPSEEAVVATSAYRAKAAQTRENIGPLIQTKWDQSAPYNSQIPVYDSNGAYVTGCVATAMAQVMYYHQCPTSNGQGSCEYQNNGNTFSANFGATTYDWSNMLTSYAGNYNDAQAKAVGTLMYHAGVAVRMNYGTGSSGASSTDVGPALASYFGYDKSIRQEFRFNYNDEDWEDLVYNELSANRPVLYSGSTSGGAGHEFICDGYDASNGMFYINWGWSGNYNGSFSLSGDGALRPSGTGTGGGAANSSYDRRQEITVNVMPDNGGVATPHYVLPYFDSFTDPLYMEINDVKYEDNYLYDKDMGSQNVIFSFAIMNASCVINHSTYFPEDANVKIQAGIKVVDVDYDNVQYFSSGSAFLLTSTVGKYSWTTRSTYFNLYDFKYNGTYELRPVYRIDGTEEWIDLEVPIVETIPTITITGAENRTPGEVNFSISSSEVMVGETVQITHDSNYQGAVTYSSSNANVATVNDQGVVTGVSEGTAVITVRGEADLDRLYLETETTFEVRVIQFEKAILHFAIEKTNFDVGELISITWEEDYDGQLTFTSSNPAIATVNEQGKITGVAEGTVEITATAAESPHYFGCQATFTVQVIPLKITFVEPPHFNNDNNPYRDDMVLYFRLRNDCGVTHDVVITAKLTMEGVSGTRTSTARSVLAGGTFTGSIDFGSLLDFMEANGRQPVLNKQYTVNLTMSNGQSFKDYPSVTFTYRDKLDFDYGVSPADYGTLVLPFNAELSEGMKVYGCTEVDENGVLTLVEEQSIRRNAPYIVNAPYGTPYHFKGPKAIDEDSPTFQEGILIGVVGTNVPLVSGTDYILQVQNDVAAFYQYTGTPSDNTDENANGNRLAAQFRSFIRLSSAGNAPKYNLPGQPEDTEGIESIIAGSAKRAGIYTIDGHRQSSFQKGLNVLILEDGTARKVFVK